MAVHHLRLRLQPVVEAVKLVEHQEAVVARDQGRVEHRVQQRKVGLRHEMHRDLVLCGGKAWHREPHSSAGQEMAALHALVRHAVVLPGTRSWVVSAAAAMPAQP